MSPAVVVVGSFMQDLSWRCERFPAAGETVLGRFAPGPGGKGSNQAVAAARAGASACLVGAVGDDEFGQSARAFYRRERIPARLFTKAGQPTGTAAILVNAAGENQIVVAAGANALLAPGDLPLALFRRARVVVGQLESNPAATLRAFQLGRRAGAIKVLNPAPLRPDFDPRLLQLADYLIPNEAEFVALAARLRLRLPAGNAIHKTAPAALHRLCRRLGPAGVIVTLGSRGCFVSQPDGFVQLPAHNVRVLDTTGAGDAFVGGFAAGLVSCEGDAIAAARFANAVAALSVTRPGTSTAMPSAREIERFLRRERIGFPANRPLRAGLRR